MRGNCICQLGDRKYANGYLGLQLPDWHAQTWELLNQFRKAITHAFYELHSLTARKSLLNYLLWGW